MDDVRDIKKTDQVSRFFDTYSLRSSPFGSNSSVEKAYRRAEKLVGAIHLLTSHISLVEPSRNAIRKIALRLLSEVVLLRDEMRSPHSRRIYIAQISIREIISLIRILALSGFVSFQNAEVLTEAVDELGNFLAVSVRSPLSEHVILEKDDLLKVPATSIKRTSSSSVRTVPGVSIPRSTMGTSSIKDSPFIKDISEDEKTSNLTQTKGVYKVEEVTARSEGILEILQSGGEMGIRDISSNLPEYSEKMIQRTLAALIAKRRVKKTGFKRWSKYSLLA